VISTGVPSGACFARWPGMKPTFRKTGKVGRAYTSKDESARWGTSRARSLGIWQQNLKTPEPEVNATSGRF
jgi:hypothetical protein